LARLISNKIIFFRIGSKEAYESIYGVIVKNLRKNTRYLGDDVGALDENNAVSERIDRALTLIEKSGGRLLRETKQRYYRSRLKVLLQALLCLDNAHYLSSSCSIYASLYHAEARELLKGFDFNLNSRSGKLLQNTFTLNKTKGRLILTNFSPKQLLSVTPNVSRLKIRFLMSNVNFKAGEYYTICSDYMTFTADDGPFDLVLEAGGTPNFSGVIMAYLWIGFERDDAVVLPKLLQRSDDIFRLLTCEATI
jgi:hypothetical protein